MLPVNIGNDSNGGRQLQKRPVTFVCLRNQNIPVTQTGIGTDTGQFASDNHGRIEAPFGQNRRHHRRGGSFSMTAGNRNGKFHF